MRQLARWCFRHWYIVIALWLLAAILANSIEKGVGSAYSDDFKLPRTDSFDAVTLLQHNIPKASGDTEQIVMAVRSGKITDPGPRATVDALLATIQRNPHVGTIQSPYTAGTHQISGSGQIAFANVIFSEQNNKVTDSQAKSFVNSVTSASGHGVEFEVGGQIAEAGNRNNSSGSLGIGFFAAAVVLFIVFGTLSAMLMPLLTAGVALGTGIAVIGLLTHAIKMPNFSQELALLIGLGVGVDYALFIVTRYRQGLLRGLSPEDAIVESIDTSGRAVLFAGTIVSIAMLGMIALGVSFLVGVGVAATVTVTFTVLAALTFGPALLGAFEKLRGPLGLLARLIAPVINVIRRLMGRQLWRPDRRTGTIVLRWRERRRLLRGELATSDESPLWSRWTAFIDKRPGIVATVAALVLILIALPVLSIRLGSADQGSDPSGSTTRKAYDLLAEGFGPGYNGPFQLVAQIHTQAEEATFVRLVAAVKAIPDVVEVSKARFIPSVHGGSEIALANAIPKGSPQAVSTGNLLTTLRKDVVPRVTAGSGVHVLVGGDTAIFADFATVLSRKLPLFVTLVVGLSFLLLMAIFRSLIVPLTAAVMNLLSAGAAFGVVTAVFQDGNGASILGIKPGPIQSFLPVIVFPIVFGLSMDYEVFLISRIYEEWHRRANNREAVTHGLAATGRTITAAAAIMVLVFGAFILGGQLVIELFGVALASAVLIDAVLVRSVLVPALMLKIGDANWKLPAVLDRILPRLNVEGGGTEAAPEPGPA